MKGFRLAELPSRAPFLLTFLLAVWAIFLPLVRADGWIPDEVRPHIGFVWNMWWSEPAEALFMANIGLVVQHSWGQILYITLLLGLVGVHYELREGPLRTFAMFYGACLTGITVLTAVILTTDVGGPHGWSEYIQRTSWSGASVGAFGVLGASVATARNPWPLLGMWAGFEYLVEWGLVPGLAVTMHIAGFLFGFVASRWIHLNPARATPTPAASATPTPAEEESAP